MAKAKRQKESFSARAAARLSMRAAAGAGMSHLLRLTL